MLVAVVFVLLSSFRLASSDRHVDPAIAGRQMVVARAAHHLVAADHRAVAVHSLLEVVAYIAPSKTAL